MNPKPTPCPSRDYFLRAAAGESGDGERAEFGGHVSDCPRCRAKLKLLSSLRREFDRVDPSLEGVGLSPAETRAFRKMARSRLREIRDGNLKRSALKTNPHRVRRFALAAGLLMVLIIGYGAVRYFTRDEAGRRRGATSLRLLSPIGRIDRAPTVFSWAAVKNADIYLFKLIDENLKTIFAGDSFQTSLVLDPDVRSKLGRRIIYLWTVEVRSDLNEKLAFREGTFVIR